MDRRSIDGLDFRRPTHCLASVLLLTATALACGPDAAAPTEPRDEIRVSESSVVNGNVDTANQFPSVAALTVPSSSTGTFCSGTLVTPKWVITANHCLRGRPGQDSYDLDVVFSPDVYSAPIASPSYPIRLTHSHRISGDVVSFPPVFLPEVPPAKSNVSQDIALVRLDQRQKGSTALPMHPAGVGGTPRCPDSVEGYLVGYGSTVFSHIALDGDAGERSWNYASGWDRETTSADEIFNKFWSDLLVSNFSQDYHGLAKGDSGGALLSAAGNVNTLCGINSATAGPTTNGFPLFWPGIENWDAAVDAPATAAWISSVIMRHGQFMGECSGPDSDGDEVPDACDNCPTVANSIQTDTDADGLGDDCDNCYGVWNPDQRNSNFDAETFAGVPHLGDVCDGFPLTVATSSQTKYTDSTNWRTTTCTVCTHAFCSNPGCTAQPCVATYSNSLHADEFDAWQPGSYIPGNPGTNFQGDTRLMFCKCPYGDPASCEAANCPRSGDPELGPSTGNWRYMASVADMHAAQTSPPQYLNIVGTGIIGGTSKDFAQFTVPTTHWNLIATSAVSTGAMFRAAHTDDWGWAYWNDFQASELPAVTYTGPPQAGQDTPTTSAVAGVVWSWVRSYARLHQPGDPALDPSTATGTTVAERQRTETWTMLDVREAVSPTEDVYCPAPFIEGFRHVDWKACPMCGAGAYMGRDAVDPLNTVAVFQPNFGKKIVTPSVAPAVVTAMQSPLTKTILVAGDEPFAQAGSNYRGVIVDLSTRSADYRLSGTGDGGVAADALTAFAAATPQTGAVLASVSARRQEVAFFGETGPDGKQLQQVRVLDLQLGTGTTANLAGVALESPQAVAYRTHDDAYYLLDLSADGTARLVRVLPGWTANVVGKWINRKQFTNFGLSAAPDGTIILSSWNTTNFAIGILRVEGFETTVHLDAMLFRSGSLAVAAAKDRDALNYGLYYGMDDVTRRTEFVPTVAPIVASSPDDEIGPDLPSADAQKLF